MQSLDPPWLALQNAEI